MKATGMVRRVDELGRVVLPAEIRQVMGIQCKDSVEIYTGEDSIILRKYQQSCVFCGALEDLVDFSEKRLCKKCLESLKQKA